MKISYLNHSEEVVSEKPHVLAIGFFDGVHLGHQELLQQASRVTKEKDFQFSVMTFDPHPDEVIKGHKNRKCLMPLPQKITKMESLGVDELFIINFDHAFASLSPAEFVRKYILQLNAKHVVVGFDFTFGYKAQGNTEYLHDKSQKHGFDLSVIPKRTYLHEKISSTRIKDLVQEGNVDEIPNYLGENYKISVNVYQKVTGEIILKHSSYALLPTIGMYLVEIKQSEKVWHGKYYQYSTDLEDNQLILEEGNHSLNGICMIAFLTKIKEAENLYV